MDQVVTYRLSAEQPILSAFLKTVSSFANYGSGTILFMPTATLQEVDLRASATQIEAMITASIVPIPDFFLHIAGGSILLQVKKGEEIPYYYDEVVYRRVRGSERRASPQEVRYLALQGVDTSYERQRASVQALTFNALEAKLQQVAAVECITQDLLKVLSLCDPDGFFNTAAQLVADNGNIRFSGIDVLRFGSTINTINYRETISDISLLAQYERAVALFAQYYCYEEIQGYTRKQRERIPKAAFTEVLARALAHRVWDINSFIQVGMYDDRIVITSPGGLPRGLEEQEYLHNNVAVVRNPTLAALLLRLKIIEDWGTGVERITRAYQHSYSQPDFTIRQNSIEVILPVIRTELPEMSREEEMLYDLLRTEEPISRAELDQRTSFDKSKTLRIINRLLDRQLIQRHGNGPGTKYSV